MKLLVFAAATSMIAAAQTVSVPLTAEAGVPLRLYLTGRLPMRMAQPVTAKVLDPVFSFDRIVIPAGAEAHGSVVKLDPVAKLVRIHALLGGDFTPLHFARVEFTSLTMPDGKMVPIHTEASQGLASIYQPLKPSKKPPKQKAAPPAGAAQNPTLFEQAKQQINQQISRQIDTQLNARSLGLGSVIRGPNKTERLVDMLVARLPYHPQWYRRGTRFDSVLAEKVDWGATEVPTNVMASIGLQPNVARVARVRFLSTVSSADAKVGEKVEATLSQPLAGESGALLLPEGTRLTGSVRQARPARWFHRSGQLRFTFDQVDVPAFARAGEDVETHRKLETAEAHVEAADTDPAANVKIDSEGGAKATESKTRLFAPALSALIAMRAMDNDAGRQTTTGASGAGNGNAGGHGLAGFSGFGLLGTALARTSPNVGVAFGWWGTAATVYTTIVSRGHDVVFARNTEMDVRFGPRPAPAGKAKGRK